MVQTIRKFFTPPVFPDDEDKTRTAKVLFALLLNMSLFVLIGALGTIFIFPQKTGAGIFIVILLMCILIPHTLVKRGHTLAASRLFVVGLWIVFIFMLLLTGRINTTLPTFLMAATIMAGILLGKCYAIIFAIMSCTVGLGLAIFENTGYPFTPSFPVPPMANWAVWVLAFILTIGPLNLTIQGFTQALTRAQASEKRYMTLFNEAPVMSLTTHMKNGTSRITDCNAAFTRILGYPREEVIGRSLDSFCPPHLQAAFLTENTFQQELWGEVKKPVERVLVGSDGRAIHTLLQITTEMDDTGQPIGLLAMYLDITDRKQAEDEIRHLNETLEQRVRERTAELEAANKELESFSYSVSHDLRAPLRAMDGFSRILEEDYATSLPPEAIRLIQSVHTGANQMSLLIDGLLQLSRLGKLALHIKTIQPIELIHQALDTLKKEQEGRELKITIKELPPCRGDPILLLQVWVNLLSNALKYTRQCELTQIEIGCQENENNQAVYYIQDNGVGFDMCYANKLFGVFQRLHNNDKFEGIGIGLALAKRIILRHGGRIWAKAQPDQGAIFHFWIP